MLLVCATSGGGDRESAPSIPAVTRGGAGRAIRRAVGAHPSDLSPRSPPARPPTTARAGGLRPGGRAPLQAHIRADHAWRACSVRHASRAVLASSGRQRALRQGIMRAPFMPHARIGPDSLQLAAHRTGLHGDGRASPPLLAHQSPRRARAGPLPIDAPPPDPPTPHLRRHADYPGGRQPCYTGGRGWLPAAGGPVCRA